MTVPNRLPEHVFIIGAGMAGLSCAQALQERGVSCELFEKKAEVGGRVNTKRRSQWQCDDGAQYFTASEPGFVFEASRWLQEGAVALWEPSLSVIESDPVSIQTKPAGPTKRFVGVPSMGALAKHLAVNLNVHLEVSIDQLRRSQLGWQVHSSKHGWSENHAQAIVLALPPEPSLALLRSTSSMIASKIATFSMRPTWALMLRMPNGFDPGFQAAFVNSGPLRWIAKDSSKPGRQSNNIWLVHANAQWSELNVERAVNEVGEILSNEFKRLTGGEAEEAALHLWRNAEPANQASNGYFWDSGLSIGVCGDWLAEGKVEGAWRSGRALANKIGIYVQSSLLEIGFSEVEFATSAYRDALALRQSVLREPLGRSLDADDLQGEETQFHFACFNKRGEVVASVSAKDSGDRICKLRQMAVHEEYRGKGVGGLLLQKVESVLKAKGFHRFELHARESAMKFYEGSGYTRVGGVFEEVGIAHLKMVKVLHKKGEPGGSP